MQEVNCVAPTSHLNPEAKKCQDMTEFLEDATPLRKGNRRSTASEAASTLYDDALCDDSEAEDDDSSCGQTDDGHVAPGPEREHHHGPSSFPPLDDIDTIKSLDSSAEDVGFYQDSDNEDDYHGGLRDDPLEEAKKLVDKINPQSAELEPTLLHFDNLLKDGKLKESEADQMEARMRAMVESVNIEDLYENLELLRELLAKMVKNHQSICAQVKTLVLEESGADDVTQACENLQKRIAHPNKQVVNPPHIFESLSGALWNLEPFEMLSKTLLPEEGVEIELRPSIKSMTRVAEILIASQSKNVSSICDLLGCRAICDSHRAIVDFLENLKQEENFNICAVEFPRTQDDTNKDGYQFIKVLVSVKEEFIRRHFASRFSSTMHQFHNRHICEFEIIHRKFHAASCPANLGGEETYCMIRKLREYIRLADSKNTSADNPTVKLLRKEKVKALEDDNFDLAQNIHRMLTQAQYLEGRIRAKEAELHMADSKDDFEECMTVQEQLLQFRGQLTSLASEAEKMWPDSIECSASSRLSRRLDSEKNRDEPNYAICGQLKACRAQVEIYEKELSRKKMEIEAALEQDLFEHIPDMERDIRKLQQQIQMEVEYFEGSDR